MKFILLLFFFLPSIKFCYAQFPVVEASRSSWNAGWVAAPNDDGQHYGVYYFRKRIDLSTKPKTFLVHVSADNRFKLYVNGTLVALGPARGDTYHWNYETVDLAPYLSEGGNMVSAVVWNEAAFRPEAQISFRTAFIVQGNTEAEEIVNTNKSWKCMRDQGYQPISGFFAASTGEFVDMNQSVKGWTALDFDDRNWSFADSLFAGQPKGLSDGFGWMLVPSSLPQMELTYQRIPALRKATGIKVPAGFPAEKAPLTIPAQSTATLLLDQTYLTNAYLTLKFSKGKHAFITIRYAESLVDEFTPYGPKKGNRNEVEGKLFHGRKDSLIADGSDGQLYTNLNFRTYRYIQLQVKTAQEPLVIDDLFGTFTGYPFKEPAAFESDHPEIKKILDIGWRTARLNAWETYTDCPYYEQLQYIGDTRVQAMITYYNSADDRLARNAITLIDHARLSDGLTLSRYPTHSTQVISTFSLWYIGMLYDYWMYRGDDRFIQDKLSGARGILEFFGKYQGEDGSLQHLPYWTFVDWANGENWSVGAPPKGTDGSSAIFDLQLLWAYQWAAAMEAHMGMTAFAALYHKKALQLEQTIQRKYWDPVKQLYADTEEKTFFSQHVNALAILTGVAGQVDKLALGKRLLADSTLTQCTIYFKYYLHQALVKAGLGNDYLNWLDIWRKNIAMGLTTWTEDSNIEFSRSDCHAWGSSPNIEFFRTVLGIDSDAPGFHKIKIEPHLGTLTHAKGTIPHPEGNIAVAYIQDKGKWKITINLPEKTSGIFVWKGKEYQVHAGDNAWVI
ncbi:hypothetical protein GCM10023231_42620 [Olivibacter ginsenosidimutans]|uniref:Bacterial alpha-L-rhamnosidase n=1 Tax=Olivibacter ginsenosidimutans TaxID=1176537 RepID=A0ABP9CGI8_9SPHI